MIPPPFLKKNYFMCMNVHMYVLHVCSTCRDLKRVSALLELESQVVVSGHVGTKQLCATTLCNNKFLKRTHTVLSLLSRDRIVTLLDSFNFTRSMC